MFIILFLVHRCALGENGLIRLKGIGLGIESESGFKLGLVWVSIRTIVWVRVRGRVRVRVRVRVVRIRVRLRATLPPHQPLSLPFLGHGNFYIDQSLSITFLFSTNGCLYYFFYE